MHRTHRRARDRQDARDTAAYNRVFKDAERARRDSRLLTLVRSGKPPFSPSIMSWLSRKLDKPSTKITPEDVKALLKS
jgi:hypothetical protein